MILEFSCPGGAREPISPTQLHVLVPIIQPEAVSISLGPAVGQEPIKFIVSYLRERGVVCVGTVDISVHQPF